MWTQLRLMNSPKLSVAPRDLGARVSDLIETCQELRDLAQWFDKLSHELSPGRTGERTARSVPGPRLPLRVDVLDTIIAIQSDTIVWEVFIRGLTDQPGRLTMGDPAGEIIRIAGDEGAEMIVLGTHGRTGMSRLLMGSVAEAIVRRAPCPVLVYRESAEKLARPKREPAQA